MAKVLQNRNRQTWEVQIIETKMPEAEPIFEKEIFFPIAGKAKTKSVSAFFSYAEPWPVQEIIHLTKFAVFNPSAFCSKKMCGAIYDADRF